jgi:glyoxylase-like metal-dependent hydrolase (beta-lactamase superfamily II)
MTIDVFTFNPFQENTYLLSDDSGDCIIIDPGCYEPREKEELQRFIDDRKLKPVRLINTHCHIDHVLGNRFVQDTYHLQLELHFLEIPLLHAVADYGSQFGIFCEPSREPFAYLNEGDTVTFGQSELKLLHTPGHSPGGLCLYNEKDKALVAGDVLFQASIGRTDLPGGDYETLIRSIREKLLTLPDDVTVYPGHGPATTIGDEKRNNPFLNE